MNRIKIQARELFLTVKHVHCPAFPSEKIVFNAKGLHHLFYKGSKKVQTRTKAEIRIRIQLLPLAIDLLKIMPVYQEESVYQLKNKVYRFWAFEGIVGGRRIKVIVRQVGNGAKHFWSVIPGWRKIRGAVRNARGDLIRQ